ncbi:MAG: prepilin-type N-terminal cleavage/methylation domain-containing protein [Planctomycetes bacterium]|nr:prepilin-type N-terminal cleavage/methylation domain-containing protein [Planctomycetota bacterium]
MRTLRRTHSAGFTLIELLVVVAILVILAGLVLPKLDKVQLKSNKAVAASNIHDVSRYIQTYRVLHNFYPDRWDSLVTTDATPVLWEAATEADPGLEPQLVGGPVPASPEKLTTATFQSDEEIRSLSRLGITTMLDLDGSASGIPGDRFTIPRTIADGDTYATINVLDDDGKAIVDRIYPENRLPSGTSGAIPSGKKLLVVGVGPLNTMIGDVVQDTPFYSNTDPVKYYHRFLAIFEFSTGGSRAELKAVVGADADRLDEEINDFYE